MAARLALDEVVGVRVPGPQLSKGETLIPVAHFTAAELPGTLAVLVFGIAIGVAAARRRTDALMLAVLGFSGLAAVGSVLDHFSGVSSAWKTGADGAFLVSALVLFALSCAGRAPVDRVAERLPAPEAGARNRAKPHS
jgi:hypothetical protein